MPFAATWMDPKGIMLSEISQTNTTWFHLYVQSKKQNKRTNQTEHKQTHRYRELVVARGKKVGGWVKKVKGIKRYKLPVIK